MAFDKHTPAQRKQIKAKKKKETSHNSSHNSAHGQPKKKQVR